MLITLFILRDYVMFRSIITSAPARVHFCYFPLSCSRLSKGRSQDVEVQPQPRRTPRPPIGVQPPEGGRPPQRHQAPGRVHQ